MATITKTFTEDYGAKRSTWTFTTTGTNITVTGDTFNLVTPSVTAKYVGTGKGYACCVEQLNFKIGNVDIPSPIYGYRVWSNNTDGRISSMASGTTVTLGKRSTYRGDQCDSHTTSLTTSNYFNSNNPTVKTLNLVATSYYIYGASSDKSDSDASHGDGALYGTSFGTVATVTLNAPPTCSYTELASDTSNVFYADISTASTTISSLSAKYGGTISSVKLTIGSQSTTRTNNGSLSIKLNAVGSFTPTISITDSRGQVRVYELNPITVQQATDTTFDCTQVASSTNGFFAGVSTASVTISNCSAPISGTVTETKLTIGTQSATGTGDGTLSIPLNAVGTFNPIVSVTDSFGRTFSQTLNAITVNAYSLPSVSFTVERTKSASQSGYTYIGEPDDEGIAGVITATINWTNALLVLSTPTVVVKNHSGTTVASSVTWYKTRAANGILSNQISDWSSIVPNDMPVYGHIDNTAHNLFDTQYSYQICITPADARSSGTEIIQMLGGAFYTIDFLAGGHGIAFGQPATEEGFFCNMDPHFKDASNVMRALFDFMHPVGSYYETSDGTFNPNTTWGGTWVLEAAGQVHVSAGTGYTLGDSGGDVSATVPTTKLTDAQMAHGHGFTQPTVNGGTCNITSSGGHSHSSAFTKHNNSGSGSAYVLEVTTSAVKYSSVTIPTSGTNGTHTHTVPDHTHTVSNGAVSNLSGASSTRTAHGHGSVSTMQPYIVVNRWHRTA